MPMFIELRYFAEVARLGSIRAASEHLNVAASAISRQVKLLEREHGAPLFHRLPRGVDLTPAGHVFLRYARNALDERQRAMQDIDALNGLRRGHVRISVIDGVVVDPLSAIIADFRGRYPQVTFDLRAMGTIDVLRSVQVGEADIGIAFHSVLTEGVRVASRTRDPLCALAGHRHPLATATGPTLADILKHPIALPDQTFGIRVLFDQVCRKARLRPDIVLETNSIEALRGHACSDFGLTMLPYRISKRDVDAGHFNAAVIRDKTLQRASVDICVNEHRLPAPAAAAFLDLLCRGFQEAERSVPAPRI